MEETMKEVEEKMQLMETDARVRRYAKSLGRNKQMPGNRKQARTRNYARSVLAADELAAVFYDLMARYGNTTNGWKLQLRSLGGAMAGLTRKEPRERWPNLMARLAVKRVLHGIDEELVLQCLKAGWKRLVGGEEPEVLERAFREKVRAAKTGVSPNRPAKKHTPPPYIVGAAARHRVSKEFGDELRQQSELERIQEQKAAQSLREALQVIKPFAREVIIGRVADRKSYAQLAEENQMTVEKVAEILKLARGFVCKYTNYFDDEWWWSDLPQGKSDKDEG
jgi:hypothetical protein